MGHEHFASDLQIEIIEKLCFVFRFNFLKQFVARINVQYKSQKAYPARWLENAWLVFGDGHNWWHQSCWWHLVALAVSLDGNGIKFGLGDNGNLSVEVDAEIKIRLMTLLVTKKSNCWQTIKNLLSGHNNFWGLNTDFCHFVFSNLIILISYFQSQCYIVTLLLSKCWVSYQKLLWNQNQQFNYFESSVSTGILTAVNRFYDAR